MALTKPQMVVRAGLIRDYASRVYRGSGSQTSYWSLGELTGAVAVDLRGLANGTYVNGPVVARGLCLGQPEVACRRFDGFTNQYVDFGDFYDLVGAGGPAYTIEMIIRPFNAANTASQIILNKAGNFDIGTGLKLQGWVISLVNSTIVFSRYLEGVLVGRAVGPSSVPLYSYREHHISIRHGASQNIIVNVDGVDGTPVFSNTNIANTTIPMHLGHFSTGAANQYQGEVNNLRFYNVELPLTDSGDPAIVSVEENAKAAIGYDILPYIEAAGGGITIDRGEPSDGVQTNSEVQLTLANRMSNLPLSREHLWDELQADGPSSFWRLDEPYGSAYDDDVIQGGINGTLVNPANTSQRQPSLLPSGEGYSLQFTGPATPAYVTMGDNYDMLNRQPFTLHAIVRIAAFGAANHGVFQKLLVPELQGWQFLITFLGEVLLTRRNAGDDILATPAVIAAGTVYQIIGRYDGNELVIWVTPASGATTRYGPLASTRNLPDTAANLNIGANSGPTGAYFNGNMQDVVLYTKAVTDARIARWQLAFNKANATAGPFTIGSPQTSAFFRRFRQRTPINIACVQRGANGANAYWPLWRGEVWRKVLDYSPELSQQLVRLQCRSQMSVAFEHQITVG